MAHVASQDKQAHAGAHLDRPDKLEREQYSISDLTTEFECTARALRFYEDEGLINPSRLGLARVYSKRDRARVAWIMRAVPATTLPSPAGARRSSGRGIRSSPRPAAARQG